MSTSDHQTDRSDSGPGVALLADLVGRDPAELADDGAALDALGVVGSRLLDMAVGLAAETQDGRDVRDDVIETLKRHGIHRPHADAPPWPPLDSEEMREVIARMRTRAADVLTQLLDERQATA